MYQKSLVSSVRINPQLKELFEGTQSLHHKSLSDAMEDGLILTLKNVVPVTILENMIAETKNRLADLEASLSYARRIEEETMRKMEKVESSEQFIESREELFVDGPGTVLRILKKNGSPNWANLFMKYGFESAKEMELYVRKEVLNRGLL